MALEERAMLVRLSISQWYNRALDRKVAEEVATKYEVSSTDSARTTPCRSVKLLPWV